MESGLHQLFKCTVIRVLREEGYALYSEPAQSPLDRLYWSSYRPDLLGILLTNCTIEVALVECETAPYSRRIMEKTSKIKRTLALQKRLNEWHEIRPLLIIPPHTFDRINRLPLRRFWEVWIVNRRGKIIHKIPSIARIASIADES